jgi:GTP-binding protein
MAGTEGRDPFDDFVKINEEIKLYNAKLETRPQIVVANKMDMPDAETYLDMFKEQLKEHGREDIQVFPVSAISRMGLQPMLYRLADLLDSIPDAPLIEEIVEVEERKVYRLENEDETFNIRRENDTFIVESPKIETMLKRSQMNSHDAIMRFARTMRRMGVDDALRKRGAKDGHYIRIGDYEFEFVEQE